MVYRELRKDEYDLLKSFLYEAIFIPEGVTPPDRSIIELPELALYYEGFGSGPADRCTAAEDEGRVIGLAWSRIMDDYGHVDDETPSLAIAVLGGYRGRGIGLGLLRDLGYGKASLAVQKENPAVRLYERAGFRTLHETGEEYIMIRDL